MIGWQERFVMGIEDLDNDHKELFRIAKRIIDTVNQNVDDLKVRNFMLREGIKYLRGYFMGHAAREEAYMRRIGHKDYALHKRLHDEFQDIQLVKYETILEKGECSQEEILDFAGTGIGWLLEHVATADMAIVGKGLLSRPKESRVNAQTVEREINFLFAATLNLDINAKVVNLHYSGEHFGEAVYQQLIYRRGSQPVTVVAGIEKRFLMRVAQMVYGQDISEADALILSTFEIFGANFWRTLGSRFVKSDRELEYKENHFLTERQLQECYQKRQPLISVLFESEQGMFFVSSDDDRLVTPEVRAGQGITA